LKICLFIFLLIPVFILGQVEIELPDALNVVVDDLTIQFNENWLDSLQYEADQNIFLYRIAGCKTAKHETITKIQLPATLKINQVIRQAIFYYSLLDTEAEKISERLLRFPLFQDTDNSAAIECHYSDNIYNFQIHNWTILPIPEEPTPEEKHLYNQFIQTAMQKTMNFESQQKILFEEFAQESSISAKKVKQVYQKVFLWKNSNLSKQ